MKRIISLSVLAMLCIAPLGCTKSPPLEEIAAGMSGITDMYTDYKDIVKNYTSRFLKDPYSAHYDFPYPPHKMYVQDPFQGVFYGHCGTVSINAKNSFGAYTGTKVYQYVINHNQVIYFKQVN